MPAGPLWTETLRLTVFEFFNLSFHGRQFIFQPLHFTRLVFLFAGARNPLSQGLRLFTQNFQSFLCFLVHVDLNLWLAKSSNDYSNFGELAIAGELGKA